MTARIESPLLTTKEAWAYLRMSRASFWRCVKRFRIKPTSLTPGKRHWRKDVLDRVIEDQTRLQRRTAT